MLAASRITPVTAFVDWNSQIHAAGPKDDATTMEICEATLRYVGRMIGKILNRIDLDRRYDVTLRVYHGWFRGFQPTDRRKAMVQIFASADFPALSMRANVVIRPTLNFGDNLTSASFERFHAHLGCHLPNTLRREILDKDKNEEKMVDTAIAGEVVDLAYREPNRWLIVVGEDDDLIPPTFIAEGVRSSRDGRVILVRNRNDSPFLKLENLRMKP